MNQIFSKEALEAASNPDELDHTLQIVRLSWIPLSESALWHWLAGMVNFGRMPVNVTIRCPNQPGQRKGSSIPSPGLVDISVAGDEINEGDIVAILQQPALEQSLQQAKENYDEINRINQMPLKQIRSGCRTNGFHQSAEELPPKASSYLVM